MANILLVEANSANTNDLFAGVTYAASQPGVVAVTMSFGANEFAGENTLDHTFTTPAGHTGVTFLASTGDVGAVMEYPAASPNVVAVGGTTLHVDANGNRIGTGETGWSGTGGGISARETQPAYQNGVVTQSASARANPDVSYGADPATGFAVYDSFGTSTPWEVIGGTSASAPQWAALIAITDEGRILAGKTPLDGPTQTLPMLYSMPASSFNDIISGSTNSGSKHFNAGPGYDLVTGRGTPVVTQVVSNLIGTPVATVATHFIITAQASAAAGTPFTITVTAANSNGDPVAGYAGTINFSSTDLGSNTVLPASYPFQPGDGGVKTFNVTLTTAGSQTISIVDAANSSLTGSTAVTVNASLPSQLSFSQQPSNVVVGVAINPAVVVRVLDAFGNLVSTDNTDIVTLALSLTREVPR